MMNLTVIISGSRPTASVDLSWLWAALISVVGAVLGGIVGGSYVLRAGRQQSQRDRQEARMDRSHQAALTIEAATAELITAMVAWRHDHDSQKLAAALQAFNLTAGTQKWALADSDLRSRVVKNIYLAASIPSFLAGPETVEVLADAICRHSQEVIDALGAHFNGQPLPSYDAPPLNDAEALRIWMTTKAESAQVAEGAPPWFARPIGATETASDPEPGGRLDG